MVISIIVVDAQTEDGQPDIQLEPRGRVSHPRAKGEETGREQELKFVQTRSGQYEAEVKAEEAGSYFLNARRYGPARSRAAMAKNANLKRVLTVFVPVVRCRLPIRRSSRIWPANTPLLG